MVRNAAAMRWRRLRIVLSGCGIATVIGLPRGNRYRRAPLSEAAAASQSVGQRAANAPLTLCAATAIRRTWTWPERRSTGQPRRRHRERGDKDEDLDFGRDDGGRVCRTRTGAGCERRPADVHEILPALP